jgi:hypothetical protein
LCSAFPVLSADRVLRALRESGGDCVSAVDLLLSNNVSAVRIPESSAKPPQEEFEKEFALTMNLSAGDSDSEWTEQVGRLRLLADRQEHLAHLADAFPNHSVERLASAMEESDWKEDVAADLLMAEQVASIERERETSRRAAIEHARTRQAADRGGPSPRYGMSPSIRPPALNYDDGALSALIEIFPNHLFATLQRHLITAAGDVDVATQSVLQEDAENESRTAYSTVAAAQSSPKTGTKLSHRKRGGPGKSTIRMKDGTFAPNSPKSRMDVQVRCGAREDFFYVSVIV